MISGICRSARGFPGDALLMTQIGKNARHCEIFKRMGECIMPAEHYAVVLRGGTIKRVTPSNW